MKRKIKKHGFTLMELIVVMAVIGILVLLAAPKFLGYTQRAQETKHIHTAKVIETALEAYLINGGAFPDDLEVVDKTLLEESAGKESLIGVNGYVTTLDEEVYYELTYDFIQKLDVKLSANNPVFMEAAASLSAPMAVYASHKGGIIVDKNNTIKGYISQDDNELENSDIPAKLPMAEAEINEWISQGYKIVSTPNDLHNVRKSLSGRYIQVNDIDLSEFENWEPIGLDYDTGFNGTYDGGGYTVSNLNINNATANNVGLFGYIREGKIRNVQLKNAVVLGKSAVGALAGIAHKGVLENVSSMNGHITGYNVVGGLVGEGSSLYLGNSFAKGNVIGFSEEYPDHVYYIGGLVGNLSGSYKFGAANIYNGYFQGNVEGNYNVGGIVGMMQNRATINKTYAVISLKAHHSFGLLSGAMFTATNYDTVIDYSYAYGEVQATSEYIGFNSLLGAKVVNSASTINRLIIKNSKQLTGDEGLIQSTYELWDFDNEWIIKEGKSYPTLINNPER